MTARGCLVRSAVCSSYAGTLYNTKQRETPEANWKRGGGAFVPTLVCAVPPQIGDYAEKWGQSKNNVSSTTFT